MGGSSNTVTVWFCCPAEGCSRAFYPSAGYYDVLSEQTSGKPLCKQDRESMVVQPDAGQGFEYVCPILGCHETQPWLAAQAAGK
jgi:hypothetical protein